MKKLPLFLLALGACGASMAQTSGPLVSKPAMMATSEPIRQIAARGLANAFDVREPRAIRDHKMRKGADANQELARSSLAAQAKALALSVPANTPYAQTANFAPLGAVMGANFEALGVGTPGYGVSSAPPDTTMAVSETHVVQWVNTQIGIYNKSGTSLLPAPGFINGNQLWQGLPDGSLCKATNRGDPIVQFDKHAKRWVFSQFAFDSDFTQNAQCIAVSLTDNPMGAYALYQYNFGALLPDYGKLGVWPDAYYITYNMFNVNANTFNGAQSCAYDRAAMLSGLAATQICFNSTDFFSFLPSDLDGHKLPPAGTPNLQISWDWYNTLPPYTIRLNKFKPDFVTPASSTFDDGQGGGTFSFVSFPLDANSVGACNDAGAGSGFQCVKQAGTGQTLDTLGDRQMYRLSYRNYGSYDALLVTQAIDDSAGVNAHLRWIEVRSPGSAAPQVYQNSTYRPSTHARWMSSGAQDKVGNIAIGYSVSSEDMNPAIRVAGRRKTDPKNLLRTEVSIKEGTGSQTGGLERWGDYSTMQVDPTDDCTFWYTQQYIAANGSFNWNTRVASFRFPNCK